ncbi:hypothetical protein VCV18_003278 [Metarhizium anisopliae]
MSLEETSFSAQLSHVYQRDIGLDWQGSALEDATEEIGMAKEAIRAIYPYPIGPQLQQLHVTALWRDFASREKVRMMESVQRSYERRQ